MLQLLQNMDVTCEKKIHFVRNVELCSFTSLLTTRNLFENLPANVKKSGKSLPDCSRAVECCCWNEGPSVLR